MVEKIRFPKKRADLRDASKINDEALVRLHQRLENIGDILSILGPLALPVPFYLL